VTLTQKIWLLVTVPFVVALATYLIATRPFRRDLLLAEASRDARDDVVVLQSAISKGLIDEKSRIADLNALTESIAQAERVIGVAVYGLDGQPLAESSGILGNPRVRELANRALLDRREVREIRGRPPHLEHAFLLEKTGTIAVCVVIRDIGYVDALVGHWTRTLFYVGIASVVLMLLISGPLVRQIVGAPLEAVVTGVEGVAAGHLDVRVPDKRRDELGRLARSFNEMTESLRTARARVDEESAQRAVLEGRMRHLQTLAAAGEVAASLAHEIGSPLNVILGRTRMMAARADTAANTKRDLEIVAAQTERITRVVRKLLDISRPPKGRIEQVNVREVVEETLAFIQHECKKRGIKQSSVVDADAPARVLADRDQLVQIVFNLCHNAIQAQPNGGHIDVRVKRAADSISGAPALAIEVVDSGPGVPEELRGRIFDPFVTTKKGEGGTGLGLAIVDGMVRELGGRVTVDDSPGGGACFRVEIPAMLEKSERSVTT
jgi:signal transduction histidine kinase